MIGLRQRAFGDPLEQARVSVAGVMPRLAGGQRLLIAPGYLGLLRSLLAGMDFEVEVAADGQQVLDLVRRRPPDLVLLGPDVPGINGFDLCTTIKAAPASHWLPVVLVTGRGSTDQHMRALDAGADDVLSKPISQVELRARVRSLLRLKAMYDGLDDADRVIYTLAAAVEAKDSYTESHTERVAITSRALGERLGLSSADLDALYGGGRIHDIGKLGVPDRILLKPGPLDREEQRQMQTHPIIGEEIVRPLRTAASLRQIIRHHHEHWDGSGYPDGLAGERIPLLARIVSICDGYDAMVSPRPYRLARTSAGAIGILRRHAGRQWDPGLVRIFTELVVPLHVRLCATG